MAASGSRSAPAEEEEVASSVAVQQLRSIKVVVEGCLASRGFFRDKLNGTNGAEFAVFC